MARYCQSCGRSVPDDARVCPYCSSQIDLSKSPVVPVSKEKKDSNKIILIIAVVIAFVIIITIAIAATVYVYVSDISPAESSDYENAFAFAVEDNDFIVATLVKDGENYNDGYLDFSIYVNDYLVDGLDRVGHWTLNEDIIIGYGMYHFEEDGDPLPVSYTHLTLPTN